MHQEVIRTEGNLINVSKGLNFYYLNLDFLSRLSHNFFNSMQYEIGVLKLT